MGHVAVTVPASLAFATFGHHVVHAAGLDKLLVELRMATDAVVHDHLGTHVFSHDGLTFGVGDEIGHMFQAVHRLETILGHQVGVRHMAVVASGVSAMRRMTPRSVLGCHDMTVDAGGGVVSDISVSPEQIHEQSTQAHNHTAQNEQPHFLLVRESIDDLVNYLHGWVFLFAKILINEDAKG